ncbi:Sec23/Sec24 trunk domain-containing protein [Dichotomocladium elegans]|nr:Sec23/Sec24 trunk domain-containing protein [Dichotomocladium elegans]
MPLRPPARPVVASSPALPHDHARPAHSPSHPPPPAGQVTAPNPPSANGLVAPMQNMYLHQQQQPFAPRPHAQPQQRPTSKRVYPQISGTAAPAGSQAGLPPAQPPHQQQQQHGPGPAVQQGMLEQQRTLPATPGSRSASAGVGYTQGPYTNTGQQLPEELRPPQQPRPRIDPDQMPAPVQVREQDQLIFGDKFFGTIERERIPLATTDYIGLDQGNCNPRYMRTTVDKIPFSKDLAETSKLPLGIIVQPLAKPKKEEVPIQTVDHGEEGPVRCSRCRAYVNPWCTFTQGGSKFVCNICAHANEVPSWYFANVDMSGRRVDAEQRPELRYGSVDFAVSADYHSKRAPSPLNYVFALDVSMRSVRSGMLQAACEAIEKSLYDNCGASRMASGSKVGIVTYDRTVHFYNLSPTLSQAQMLVVSDLNEMFVPLEHGFLANPGESSGIIIDLLRNIPQMFKDSVQPESVFTPAVRSGLLALSNTGGNLFVFQSCLPNHGPGALKTREDKSLYNTEKEKQLFSPQNDAYKALGKECVDNAVCVHTWLFPAEYIDAATVGVVSNLTGGDLRYYPNFNANESSKIVYQLDHDLHRDTGYDGVLRIRCSDGLQVIDHYGNCHMSTYTDMDLAGIDEDKAIAAVLKHDSKLDVSRNICFQAALLYTTKAGERRVRVHNLSLSVTNQIAEVFRSGDEDAAISVILRKAIFDSHHKSRRDIHKKMTDDCVNILTAYRTNCAASTSPGQLILPEAFKLLPVYVHGSMRSQALRGVGVDVNSDSRIASMHMLNSQSVYELVTTIYPRLYSVSGLADETGLVDIKGQVKLPAMTRASYDRLSAEGAYLLDTGSDLFFWLGKRISTDFLEKVFGVSTLDQVDVNMTTLPLLDNPLSERINDTARKLQSDRSRYLQLRIVRQEKDAIEFVFSTWMSEDRNAEVQTYVDYMCVLHRKIQDEMKKNSNY